MADESMKKAYRIAHELLRDRIQAKAPELLEDLKDIEAADVIVTTGQYDHIQSVFEVLGTPYTLIDPLRLDHVELRPDQIVFVNCPGQVPPLGLRKLAAFVEAGGFLFTTDWALKHVLEPAFPGYVAYNQQKTRDEVVRIEVVDKDDPFLASILGPNDDPQWWLEASSFPIKILDPQKVKVLITSREIRERYGEAPVFVTFDVGAGRVYHMISHFYLQRTETRTDRHRAKAEAYLKEKQIAPELMAKYRSMGVDGLDVGRIESAYTSHSMMRRIMHEKQRQMREEARRKKEEGDAQEKPSG